MSRATPEMRVFAERLAAHEMRRATPEPKVAGAFRVCEKLRPHLATFMGKAGFHALMSRALSLAATEAPELCAVQLREDGALPGDEEWRMPADVSEMAEGSVVLLAQLLGLLEAFIGQNLTLQMLREVWPELSLSDMYFDEGDQK